MTCSTTFKKIVLAVSILTTLQTAPLPAFGWGSISACIKTMYQQYINTPIGRIFVSAALDGTVIFTGWTMETGFVIEVQHPNNIVSVYKHNSSILKETGDLVRAGEAISVVGDSGELYTSGPHLHFEIWYKGSPLDPEKHILF